MLVLGRRVDSAPLVLIGLLTVLPAVWLALAGLVSLAALLPRPEPRRLGLAALWWAAFGWTWGLPALPGGEPVVAPIRVLSWNVQRLLFEDDDQGAALACVADGVRRAAPDVLVEQLQQDAAVMSADTLMLTIPSQLGVAFNLRLVENFAKCSMTMSHS